MLYLYLFCLSPAVIIGKEDMDNFKFLIAWTCLAVSKLYYSVQLQTGFMFTVAFFAAGKNAHSLWLFINTKCIGAFYVESNS